MMMKCVSKFTKLHSFQISVNRSKGALSMVIMMFTRHFGQIYSLKYPDNIMILSAVVTDNRTFIQDNIPIP